MISHSAPVYNRAVTIWGFSVAQKTVKKQLRAVAAAADVESAREHARSAFRFGFLVHDVSRLRRTVFDKALKPLGVTRSQWWVLGALTRHRGESMMQTELAELLEVGKVALGGLLDRLEAGGLVKRVADPNDRRAKRIKLTIAGAHLMAKIQQRAAVANAEMVRDLTPQEIDFAEDILHRVKVRLIEMEKQNVAAIKK